MSSKAPGWIRIEFDQCSIKNRVLGLGWLAYCHGRSSNLHLYFVYLKLLICLSTNTLLYCVFLVMLVCLSNINTLFCFGIFCMFCMLTHYGHEVRLGQLEQAEAHFVSMVYQNPQHIKLTKSKVFVLRHTTTKSTNNN